MTSSQPTTIGKYEIVSVLGKGAMGVVYRAVDPSLGRQVAIKTMSGDFLADHELRIRFLREAQSAGQLQHPNIVTVHELLQTEDAAYIVMELLEGASLYALLRKGLHLAIAEKLSIVIQVASGLHHAHERGIVHRDLKPSNVFIVRNGTAKIVDFGVAKFGESELTRAGTVFGTLEYMAPEQVQGKPVDARADIFSLGVVAYELLTGHNPFRAETIAASVFKVLSDNPESMIPRAKGVSPEIERVVFRALSKRAELRFDSAAELVAALRTAAQDAAIEPRPPRLPVEVVDSASREAVFTRSEAPQVSQWSHVAAAAGHLDEMFRAGIDCFGKADYEGCVLRMSEVLDAVPVHSMALHYLSQSEAKLRQQHLDPARHRQASSCLSAMRQAHREGHPQRVIESANELLSIDAESMEARWYRRNAETRLTPSPTSRAVSHAAPSRAPLSIPSNSTDTSESRPTLVLPSPMTSTDRSRSVGIWVLGAAGILSVALIVLVWGFTGKGYAPTRKEPSARTPSQVRPSKFEDDDAVVLHVPTKKPPEVTPTITTVLPKQVVADEVNTVRLFGNHFVQEAQVLSASAAGDVEVLTVKVVSPELIETTIRPASETAEGQLSLLVVNPNGGRSLKYTLSIVSHPTSDTSALQ